MNTMADVEREKFEAWCGDRYDLATKKDTFGERQYKDRWVQGAFVGWKASIAARQPVGEPVCTDCGTPLLYECPGCSKMNYPQPSQAVELIQWSQQHAEDLNEAIHTALSVHAGSLSQKKRDAISEFVKRLIIESMDCKNG